MPVRDLISELFQRVTRGERAGKAFPEDLVPGRPGLPGTGSRTFSTLDPFLVLERFDVAHRILEGVLIIASAQGPAPFALGHPV